MAERHLHAIDAQTGELVTEGCPGCAELTDQVMSLNKVVTARDRMVSEVRNELANLRAVEPEAQDIIDVLTYCREQWGKRWAIVPGSKRWGKVRERLKDRPLDADPFTKAQLCKAADGALLDPWLSGKHHKSKGYLIVETVYRDFEQVERLIDLADGFEVKTGLALQDFPPELRNADLRFLTRRCDCGCLRLEHYVPAPDTGFEACRKCADCIDFYDGEAQLRDLEAKHTGGGG